LAFSGRASPVAPFLHAEELGRMTARAGRYPGRVDDGDDTQSREPLHVEPKLTVRGEQRLHGFEARADILRAHGLFRRMSS
jgi:hypothetical protein